MNGEYVALPSFPFIGWLMAVSRLHLWKAKPLLTGGSLIDHHNVVDWLRLYNTAAHSYGLRLSFDELNFGY